MGYTRFPDSDTTNIIRPPQYQPFPEVVGGHPVPGSPTYFPFPPTSNPLTILGAGSVVAWWRSDLAVVSGGVVDQWTDRGTGGFHLTAAGGVRPAYNATGGPNGVPSIGFDGTDDILSNAILNLPAPATTATTIWTVFRQDVATASDRFFGASGDNFILYTPAANNDFIMFDGANGPNSGAAIATNTYARHELYFSGSASDYGLWKATLDTGPSSGNNDPGAGWAIGAGFGAAAGWAICSFVEMVLINRLLTAPESAAMTSYGIGRYGPGVFA